MTKKMELLERKEELIDGYNNMLHTAVDLYNKSIIRYNKILDMIDDGKHDAEKLYQLAKDEENRIQTISDQIFKVRKILMEIISMQVASDDDFLNAGFGL